MTNDKPAPTVAGDEREVALALLDKRSNYMGGIGRGQRSIPVDCALRAVMEALSQPVQAPTEQEK